MTLANFTCPANLLEHMSHVFQGEYNIAVEYDSAPVFLDIGGCVGAATTWARTRWPGCAAFVYEPNPKVHRVLEKNLARLGPDIVLHKTAVLAQKTVEADHEQGTVRLFQGRNNLGEASIYLETGAVESDHVDVPITWAKDLPPCDILKADCEGPEREIVLEYLAHHEAPSAIMVEYHHARESRAMQREFAEHGYRLVKAIEYEFHRGVLCWRHEP